MMDVLKQQQMDSYRLWQLMSVTKMNDQCAAAAVSKSYLLYTVGRMAIDHVEFSDELLCWE
jgi:hypothetical protein